MKKDKKFDAVLSMREIRQNLSEKYWKNPEILKTEMRAIKEKYNLKLESSITKKDSIIQH